MLVENPQRSGESVPSEPGTAPRRGGPLRSALRMVGVAEASIGALLVLLILTMVIVQVTIRFLPSGGWVWTGEIAKFGLVWLAFIMAGHLLAKDQHISLDVIDHVLPERGRRIVRRLSHAIVGVICAVFAYEGLELVSSMGTTKSPAAGIPMSLFYVLPLAGFVLTLVRAVLGLLLRRIPT
jgi:TRAP-type C4-dicarboxylate transport system permease small subunit